MRMHVRCFVVVILSLIDFTIQYSSHVSRVPRGPLDISWRKRDWQTYRRQEILPVHMISTTSYVSGINSVKLSKSSALHLFRNFANNDSGGKLDVDVGIESPSINSRRITASIMIDDSLENVWKILTDYDSLSENVPNLVKSYTVPSPKDVTRIFQEGAQKIIGFEFRASLMMDMTENLNARDVYSTRGNNVNKEYVSMALSPREIGFELVESTMFSEFSGSWTLVPVSSSSKFNSVSSITGTGNSRYQQTKLTYSVFIRPKGPVPILALEWRIREDIPVNLVAVKAAAESLGRRNGGGRGGGGGDSKTSERMMKAGAATAIAAKAAQDAAKVAQEAGIDWGIDETLGQYIGF